jgi:hypothetical protein
MDCMDMNERAFLDGTLELLRGLDPPTAKSLEGQLARVINISAMANSFPSLLEDHSAQSSSALVETLCQVDAGLSSLNLPMRAVMGETFLTAKIQLFQAFRQALSTHAAAIPPPLLESAGREVAQSVHTLLLMELLWDLVRNQQLELEVRQRAATELVRLWESPDKLEVDDFFPVLEAVWQARNRVNVTYGSLVGVSEFFQLLREDCPPLFVGFFTRSDVSPEEQAAFQEFLFGLPQEALKRLREAMEQKGLRVIDRQFAEDTLKLPSQSGLQERTAEAIYASFRRRQRACHLRRMTGTPGPTNTAEAYLILHLLEHPMDQEETVRISLR